jgi:hypothetical protein
MGRVGVALPALLISGVFAGEDSPIPPAKDFGNVIANKAAPEQPDIRIAQTEKDYNDFAPGRFGPANQALDRLNAAELEIDELMKNRHATTEQAETVKEKLLPAFKVGVGKLEQIIKTLRDKAMQRLESGACTKDLECLRDPITDISPDKGHALERLADESETELKEYKTDIRTIEDQFPHHHHQKDGKDIDDGIRWYLGRVHSLISRLELVGPDAILLPTNLTGSNEFPRLNHVYTF